MAFETRPQPSPTHANRRRWSQAALAGTALTVVILFGRLEFPGKPAREAALGPPPRPEPTRPLTPAPPPAQRPAPAPATVPARASVAPAATIPHEVRDTPAAATTRPVVAAPSAPRVVLASSSTERRRATTWVNLRAERAAAAAVVRVLQPGESVDVDSLGGGWFRVVADGRAVGYVDRRLVEAEQTP